jgi:phage tail-like protein
MNGLRDDPVSAHNFLVALVESTSAAQLGMAALQSVVAGFSQCSGLESTMQPEEYRQGGENETVLKFPSRVAWSNVRLRRGVTTSDLWDWYDGFVQGRGRRRDGLIILQDDLRVPLRIWRFRRGMPVRWMGPGLDAQQSAVAVEELEIAHEGLAVQSPGGAA